MLTKINESFRNCLKPTFKSLNDFFRRFKTANKNSSVQVTAENYLKYKTFSLIPSTNVTEIF